ncbi:MAG: acyl-CoA thioesterase [Planctomycetes bacterium]|nr:acyl-CoA thioesterase [Planctomycetota bacterium]
MPFVSTFDVSVHSYEIDVYNHVNNAVYIQWCEHGRSKLLQDKGFDYTSIIEKWGVQFMTVRTEIDYKQALYLGDSVNVRTWIERFGNTSITVAHSITKGYKPVADAKVVVVYTDAKTGKPTPVPEEFVRLYG